MSFHYMIMKYWLKNVFQKKLHLFAPNKSTHAGKGKTNCYACQVLEKQTSKIWTFSEHSKILFEQGLITSLG